MGVNLWADTVYLETVRYSSGVYDTRPSLVPVSRAEFDNMTGRAGRLRAKSNGDNCHPGRAIVLAESDFDRDILWERYIAPSQPTQLRSAFDSQPVEDWLLNMIVSGLLVGGSSESIEVLYAHTLHAATGVNCSPPDFVGALKRLAEERLIGIDDRTGAVSATTAGRAASGAGLTVRQAAYYRHKLQAGFPETDFGWIALALSGPDWQLPPAILSRWEQSQSMPLRTLYQNFDHLINEAAHLLGSNQGSEPLAYRTAASLKALLLLEEWKNLAPVRRLEERFQLHLGQITALGATAAHLINSISRLVEASDRETPVRERLNSLVFSLRTGLPAEFGEIHFNLGHILNRSDFQALRAEGIDSLAALCELTFEQLSQIVKCDRKCSKINKKLTTLKEEVYMNRSAAPSVECHGNVVPPIFTQPESLEIDGSYERERYLVRVNGFPVRLTGKSFKYIARLAWSRLHQNSGWVFKEDLEVGFNQARYLYRMKGEVNAGINFPWSVVENNRLGYYRLSIDPARISIKMENLKNHPDYELRSLISDIRPESVN